MKKWGLRLLSAFLTFMLGLYAATVVNLRISSASKVQPVSAVANIKAQRRPQNTVVDTESTDEIMQPHPVSISPFEIKELIDDNNLATRKRQGYDLFFYPIWNRLGIKPEVASQFVVDVCHGTCHVDVSTLELDSKSGKETVLKLSKDLGWQAIYLIFKKDGHQSSVSDRWILLGYINSWAWLDNSHLRVLSIGTSRWLVIRHCTGHGNAGYYREDDDWYEVSDRGLVPVMSYRVIGTGGMNPFIESKTRILETESSYDGVKIVLEVSDTYQGESARGTLFPLWAYRKKVVVIKPPHSSRFVPELHDSEMSEESICEMFSPDGSCGYNDYSSTSFLEYNYPKLVSISNTGNRKQRDWLRDFLKYCDDSLVKQSLQKALGSSQP